jgi:Holliday junction resolvasome RuvABC endonuclease subunit
MTHNKLTRILAIAPTARGFGYAIMEGSSRLIAFSNKAILRNKNVRTLVWVEKFIRRYDPAVLVLPAVNAADTRRAKRIKHLHQRLVALAAKRKLKVKLITTTKVRERLLGQSKGNKQSQAEMLAGLFPIELAPRLPPKRKAWKSEDPRMDIFDAAGLAVAFWPK